MTDAAKLQARIMLDGDPEPWDAAEGGDLVYERPTREHPQGRTVHEPYVLIRSQGKYEQRKHAPRSSVTITFDPYPDRRV